MLNSQLEELNLVILKSLKDDFYISLSPLEIENETISSLEIGDIIYFEDLEFVIRDKKRVVALLMIAKSGSKEGFLVSKLLDEEIKNQSKRSLDIRVAKVLADKIKENNWIEFNWRVSKSLFIFAQERVIGKGELVILSNGFGVRVKAIYE